LLRYRDTAQDNGWYRWRWRQVSYSPLLSLRPPPDTPLQTIGTIARVAGGATVSVGQAVHSGEILRTAVGQGIGVTLPGGLSLRIAAESSLRFDESDNFTLLSGEVYADSGQQIYRDRHITIHTATGSVTDIGTQFAVQFDDDELSVAVREGKVDITGGQKTHTAVAGDKLLLRADKEVVVDQIAANDDSWEWAVALAPGFDIDNKSLLDFLKWAARETGKELVFTSDQLRMAAMKAKLYGSVSDFTPQEATESVLSTTNFDFQIDEHRITIGE
jgi:FecR protein